MWIITRHLSKFRRSKRGISSIIVIVLSLVILVVIASNVILWSYHMNQVDWERMQESITLINAGEVNSSTWTTAQREYIVNLGSRKDGNYTQTRVTDDFYESFQEENQTVIRPNDPGRYTEWGVASPAGAPHWECCDEEFPDDDFSYVQTTTQSWLRETYDLKNLTAQGAINWVRLYVRARHDDLIGPEVYIRTLVRTHDADYASSNIVLTSAYRDVYTQYDTNPSSMTPWTWDEVNSLQIGVYGRSFGGRFTRLTAVWAIVNYDGQKADIEGNFPVETSTYPLTHVNGLEFQLRYRASDSGERWYLEAYNWTSGEYTDNGFNSSEGHLPTTAWDYYTVNLTDRWDSYVRSDGMVKIKLHDAASDYNRTLIDVDFLAIRVFVDGMHFTFNNKGPLTCHIVSVWIIGLYEHRRYELDIYVNAGDLLDYVRADISMPDDFLFVKATTERGNIAVYLPV